MSSLHISLSAEPVAHIAGLTITNSILTSLVVSALIVTFAFAAKASLKTSGKPTKFQALVEFIVESFRNMVRGVAESDRKVEIFTPVILSFFMFIIMNNWFGLLPGVGTIGFKEEPKEVRLVTSVHASEEVAPVANESETSIQGAETSPESSTPKRKEAVFVPYFRAGTADLNTTIALALISVVLTQVYGVYFQKMHYFGKYINFSSPINFFVGLLETVLELAKVMSFAFRLFGNIFAGEVLLAVMMFLVPLVIPMPFYGMEIFVGFIQALVFSMLSLVFFSMATIGHDEEH